MEKRKREGKTKEYVVFPIRKGHIIAVTARTKAILAILDPIILPYIIFVFPDIAAFKLTNNSGADVAKDKTVKPITKVEIPILNANDVAPFTRSSPPK